MTVHVPISQLDRILKQTAVTLAAEREREENQEPPEIQSDIIRWNENHFYLPATAKPVRFLPHQKCILRMAYRRNRRGRFPYQTQVLSTIKQSGKSAMAGMVGRWMGETQTRYGEIFTIGNDKDQAKGRSFREVRYSIELSPDYNRAREQLPGRWSCQNALTLTCLSTGTQIKAIAVDAKGEAGGKPALTIWCVTGETEVLCRAGWKQAQELTTADEIAALNPATGAMEWQRPRAVNVTPYKGRMKRFVHRRVEFTVTPNHRVFGRFLGHSRNKHKAEDRGWWFEEADRASAFGSGYFKGDADWQSEVPYDPRWAKFMGYYIAEGHVSSPYIWLSQSRDKNPETYEEMRLTLTELGYAPYEGSVSLRIKDVALAKRLASLGKSWEKFIPNDLKDANKEALSAFFLAYMAGDGWSAGRNGWQCVTTSARLVDDLMEVGLKLGYHPRFMNTRLRPRPAGRGLKAPREIHQIHRLSFSRGPIYWERTYPSGRAGKWEDIEYEGNVACPSLPHGIFYIRSNGKCVWTGNTELWGFEREDALRFWDEMTPVPTVPDSLRLVETYAGYDGESTLLWDLYETARKGCQCTAGELARAGATSAPGETYEELLFAFAETNGDPDALVPVWVNEAASLFMYWDSGPNARRMPWQQGESGDEYYRNQEGTLPANAYRRMHGNEWVGAESQFVPIESWDRCYDPSLPPLMPGDRTMAVISADAASTQDCFAIVLVTRHPDPALHDSHVAIRAARKWDPKEEGGRIDYQGPEDFLRLLCGGGCGNGHGKSLPNKDCPLCAADVFDVPAYNVQQICYDPYQLESTSQRLRKEGVAWLKPFSQQLDRLKADRQLYDLIVQGRLHHREDPRGARTPMREHILNANAKVEKDQDSKLRIIKKSAGRKIDLTVAMSMGSARCLELLL